MEKRPDSDLQRFAYRFIAVKAHALSTVYLSSLQVYATSDIVFSSQSCSFQQLDLLLTLYLILGLIIPGRSLSAHIYNQSVHVKITIIVKC